MVPNQNSGHDSEFQNMQKFLKKKDENISCQEEIPDNGSSTDKKLEPPKKPKVNTDCITRDAQNVYDKKKQRFEKIQKLRGSNSGKSLQTNNFMNISENMDNLQKCVIKPS